MPGADQPPGSAAAAKMASASARVGVNGFSM